MKPTWGLPFFSPKIFFLFIDWSNLQKLINNFELINTSYPNYEYTLDFILLPIFFLVLDVVVGGIKPSKWYGFFWMWIILL